MKRLVLHSGGLDSTVCLMRAAREGSAVVSVGINYGQRHFIELQYAERQCAGLGIERKVLEVKWDKPPREIPQDRPIHEMTAGSSAFLPGRNAIFLALACAQAYTMGASEVWIGVNSVDFSGYPDCKADFVDAFNQMVSKAIPAGPIVVAPLLLTPKGEIAREAASYGLRPADTWSCYRPSYSNGTAIPCGRCDACRLHEFAWQQSGAL